VGWGGTAEARRLHPTKVTGHLFTNIKKVINSFMNKDNLKVVGYLVVNANFKNAVIVDKCRKVQTR